jgi:hydroxymethylpyrimidine/phosphomethylpyrimidine kinase
VLVVGGHDSSGGAGVGADREAIEAAGARALVVVSAWTVQDERGVHELGATPPDDWLREARAHLGPRIGALKFGLLPGAGALRAARELTEELPRELPVVLDPVLASSSGTRFHDSAGLAALRRELLPAGLVWTPNLPELAELCGADFARLVETPEDRLSAAHQLLAAGARGVVVKGGHGREQPLLDLVLEVSGREHWLEHARLPGAGMRGSGCRFASALAVHLALGRALPAAAAEAACFVAGRIASS